VSHSQAFSTECPFFYHLIVGVPQVYISPIVGIGNLESAVGCPWKYSLSYPKWYRVDLQHKAPTPNSQNLTWEGYPYKGAGPPVHSCQPVRSPWHVNLTAGIQNWEPLLRISLIDVWQLLHLNGAITHAYKLKQQNYANTPAKSIKKEEETYLWEGAQCFYTKPRRYQDSSSAEVCCSITTQQLMKMLCHLGQLQS